MEHAKNKVILIAGVPGTGKTTIATRLAYDLRMDVLISTDVIKDTLKSIISESEMPLLYFTTHEAWKYFGSCNEYNVIKGAQAASNCLYKTLHYIIKQATKQGCSVILEGAQLMPSFYLEIDRSNSDVFYYLLTVADSKEHFTRFDLKNSRRLIKHQIWYENYQNIQVINAWWINECCRYHLSIVPNHEIENTIRKIKQDLEGAP